MGEPTHISALSRYKLDDEGLVFEQVNAVRTDASPASIQCLRMCGQIVKC